jgi:hypothetical protein
MPRTSLYSKTYGSKNKQQAAAAAVARARETILNSRRGSASAGGGGYYGFSRGSRDELKTIDVAPTQAEATTTASITLLNGVATGTDFTNRIGRKINMKSLYLRVQMAPIDQVTSDTHVRMLVVYDMQPNGAAPAITDVLNTASTVDHINLNNRDRFKILVDKCVPIGANVNTATQAYSNGKNVYYIKKYLNLNLKGCSEVLYSGTGSTIASIATGSIYFLYFSGVAAGNGTQVTWSSRIRFSDS